jgi:hypothetical protein
VDNLPEHALSHCCCGVLSLRLKEGHVRLILRHRVVEVVRLSWVKEPVIHVQARKIKTTTSNSTTMPSKPHRWQPSITARTLLMVLVGFVAFVIVGGVVLYKPIVYGDAVEDFGIVMMLTVPVIAAVAFRVVLDSWVDSD